MKPSKMRLRLYRGLYWANQGLLHAVRALDEAKAESPQENSIPPSGLLHTTALLNEKVRRTQAMIEETRTLMNHMLAEWVERKE